MYNTTPWLLIHCDGAAPRTFQRVLNRRLCGPKLREDPNEPLTRAQVEALRVGADEFTITDGPDAA